jgi:chromosome transmission fidelity protein 1
MAGEPDWMVDNALRRKREELARKWEEREKAMERVRQREKEMEERAMERGRKRVRVDDEKVKGEVDEEREFLITDWESGEVDDGDSLGQLSKETRALMEKVGLGGGVRRSEEEAEVEEEVKVCDSQA